MTDESYEDKEDLRRVFERTGRNISATADFFGCHWQTISRWLDRHNIDRRSGEGKFANTDEAEPYHDGGTLRQMYHGEDMSMPEIADEFGVSWQTIQKWMDRNGIERREHNDGDAHDIPEDELRRIYEEEETLTACADHFGCSLPTIRNRIYRYGIERRHDPTGGGHNRVERATVYWKDGYLTAKCSQCGDYVGIHQLVAIADGADPYEVFSGGDSVTHHINEHKGDNRPSNLLVTDPGTHENIHNAEWLFREGTDEEIDALASLLAQKGYTDRLVGAAGRAGSPAT